MKKLSTHILTIYCIALVIVSALLIAASPYQTGESPAPVDPLDTVYGAILTLLSGVIAWMFIQLRNLKEQAAATIKALTPDAWEWVVLELSPILVRAICQAVPQQEAQNILIAFQTGLWRELSNRGITIPINTQMGVARLIEEAVQQFYEDLNARRASEMKVIHRAPNP